MARDNFPWFRKDKKCWYVWLDGRQVRLDPDKEKAFAAWHRLAASRHDSPPARTPGTVPTVGRVVADHLDDAGGRLKPSTVLARRKVLARLAAHLGGHAADSLTPKVVLGWLDLQAWGRSLRWFAAGLVRSVFRDLSPSLAKLKVPGPRSRGADSLVDAGDLDRLLRAAPPEYREALEFLFETGCRPGELCSAEARHLDAAASVLALDKHKTEGTGVPRVIHLSRKAHAIVARLALCHPRGPLFRTCAGKPMTPERLRNWVFKARRRLGIAAPLFPYGLRHSFATDALSRGVPDALVAELLGHKGTAVLHKHYAHLTARAQALREALSKVR